MQIKWNEKTTKKTSSIKQQTQKNGEERDKVKRKRADTLKLVQST